jgi:hypothetical protein
VLDEVETVGFDEVEEGVVVGVVEDEDEDGDEDEDEDEDEVGEPPQAPVMEGTASTPLEIATRFVPQSAALAMSKFWLSWSYTTANCQLSSATPIMY